MVHSVTIFEREPIRAAIFDAMEQTRGGIGTSLFLVGEAGLGKTTLVNEACAQAKREGFSVAFAACSEVDTLIPLAMLERLLSGVELSPMRVDRLAISSADMLAARYIELSAWLREPRDSPLLLVVDDLQWADPDSLTLLTALCRRLDGVAAMVLAATRTWPPGAIESARCLAGEDLAGLEHLTALSDYAGQALLRECAGGEVPPESASRALASCAGNPLLLAEVGRGWARGEDMLSGSGPLSERVFLPRFAGVGARGLRWARAASVLGTRFYPPHVDALLGLGGLEGVESLEALCEAGVMRAASAGEAEFVHPLLREALYQDMAVPVRRAAHARAFSLLSERGLRSAQAAAHALAAELHGDSEAIAGVLGAARAALATGAMSTAVEYFAGALRLAGDSPDPAVLRELAETCLLVGRVDQAETAARRLLDLPGLGEEMRLCALRVYGQTMMASARLEEAERASQEASNLALGFDPALAVEILLDGAYASWIYRTPRIAGQVVERAFGLAREIAVTDPRILASATAARANLACISGDPSGFDELAVVARPLLRSPHPNQVRSPWAWDPVFAYINVAKILERFDECTDAYALLAETTKNQGAELSYWSYSVNHSDVLWRTGRLEEAYALLYEGAGVAELFRGLSPFVCIGLAFLSHERELTEECDRWTGRVTAAMAAMGEMPYLRLWLLYIDCSRELGRGRSEVAAGIATRIRALAESSGILEPCAVPWHATAIEAFTAAGRLEEASELAGFLGSLCARLPCHAPRAVALAGSAWIEWLRGDPESAEALYRDALAHNAAVAMPIAHAETLIGYGRFLRLSGNAARARKVLGEAGEMLEPTGARRLQELAYQEFAVAGGQARRRNHASPGLTAQEKRVADLAAGGLTNKEIAQSLYLSAKTVDHHLASVYQKLGLKSRRELMLGWQAPGGGDG